MKFSSETNQIFFLLCPVALNPTRMTMLAGSIALYWANRVQLIVVVHPIDKIRLQLLQVFLHRLLHPCFCTIASIKFAQLFEQSTFVTHVFISNLKCKINRNLSSANTNSRAIATRTIWTDEMLASFFCCESNKNHYDGCCTRFCERDR